MTAVSASDARAAASAKIIFHNFLQFWDPLFEFFDELRLRKMIYQNPDELYTVRESSDAVVEYLKGCVR